ncbi:hypothetical protein V8G54_037805 [Vigna mungo]|uniref:Neprosin PEP catalytic domain-containing protein n=1 Tax=Vigna mungo TaxID=3915 RepID=A0AAQ3RFQ7_VIGMU
MRSTMFILLWLLITVHGISPSRHKILEVERKLKYLRRHSLKTIKMAPTHNSAKEELTGGSRTSRNGKNSNESLSVTSQVWQKSGKCGKGTIPVRRIRKRELLKAHSIEEYGRKKPSFSHHQHGEVNKNLDSFVQLKNHSVNPSVYGDRQTRLFVYWTLVLQADGSKESGCFDLTCPGFIQTSNEIALGAAIHPISIPGDLPYVITIYIFKDPYTNNWWVQYGEKTNIGYWPPELFETILYNAQSVEWGGEVYSTSIGQTPHTATQMGNGQFASVLEFSSAITRMRIHDNSEVLKIPELVYDYSDEYNCYDVWYMSDYIDDPQFYYGGPGRNPKCP